MRLALAAILALALGLLPVGTARAVTAPDSLAQMVCHEMMGAGMPMDGGDEQPSHDMQVCADHCLSQVNGQAIEARQPEPSLENAIRAELGGALDLGKAYDRNPPDPPPPRS